MRIECVYIRNVVILFCYEGKGRARADGYEDGHELVYHDMKEGVKREPVGTKTGYETVCMIQSKNIIYPI